MSNPHLTRSRGLSTCENLESLVKLRSRRNSIEDKRKMDENEPDPEIGVLVIDSAKNIDLVRTEEPGIIEVGNVEIESLGDELEELEVGVQGSEDKDKEEGEIEVGVGDSLTMNPTEPMNEPPRQGIIQSDIEALVGLAESQESQEIRIDIQVEPATLGLEQLGLLQENLREVNKSFQDVQISSVNPITNSDLNPIENMEITEESELGKITSLQPSPCQEEDQNILFMMPSEKSTSELISISNLKEIHLEMAEISNFQNAQNNEFNSLILKSPDSESVTESTAISVNPLVTPFPTEISFINDSESNALINENNQIVENFEINPKTTPFKINEILTQAGIKDPKLITDDSIRSSVSNFTRQDRTETFKDLLKQLQEARTKLQLSDSLVESLWGKSLSSTIRDTDLEMTPANPPCPKVLVDVENILLGPAESYSGHGPESIDNISPIENTLENFNQDLSRLTSEFDNRPFKMTRKIYPEHLEENRNEIGQGMAELQPTEEIENTFSLNNESTELISVPVSHFSATHTPTEQIQMTDNIEKTTETNTEDFSINMRERDTHSL